MKSQLTQANDPRLSGIRRKPVSLSKESLVKTERLDGMPAIPVVLKPVMDDVNLAAWAADNREWIETLLSKAGAILMRGFGVKGAIEFERVVEALSGAPIQYDERTSPRSQVRGGIYTSTDHPADQSIFPHNEHSYAMTFPSKLFFFCSRPARAGGETPIADTRKVFERLQPEIKQRFLEKNWMFVRNYGEGFGLSWEVAFQTRSRFEVEEFCGNNQIEFEWKSGGRLRTRQVRPATIVHPKIGETLWFNHITFFHISTLEPAVRDSLLAEFREEDLPNNTYYGDGSTIEPWVMEELRGAYLEEQVSFSWRTGDILLIDNLMTSHGRAPFEGERETLVAMTDPITRTDC